MCVFDSKVKAHTSAKPVASPGEVSYIIKTPKEYRIRRTLTVTPFKSNRELLAFEHFRQLAVPQISGFLTRDFWTCELPRAAQSNPGIRHALLALGAVHKSFMEHDREGLDAGDFALRQYNMAIRYHLDALQKSHSRINMGAYIVSCILFVCIESMRGRIGSALALIKQAASLMHSYGTTAATSTPMPWSDDVAEMLVGQLRNQAAVLVGPGFVDIYGEHSLSAGKMDIPTIFRSITEAADSFQYHLAEYLCDTWRDPDRPEGHVHMDIEAIATIRRWLSAFDRFMELHESQLSVREMAAANMLKMKRLFCFSALEQDMGTCRRPNQMLWDKYIPVFLEIVELGEAIIGTSTNAPSPGSSSSSDTTSQPSPTFTLDLGIVSTMYDVSNRCRDPVIRRRAWNVLRVAARQEGIYDGFLATRVAAAIIELEESACEGPIMSCADVPKAARITCVSRRFDPEERRGYVGYFWGGGEKTPGDREPCYMVVDY